MSRNTVRFRYFYYHYNVLWAFKVCCRDSKLTIKICFKFSLKYDFKIQTNGKKL